MPLSKAEIDVVTFRLLANCSTNPSLGVVNEDMDPMGRLMYLCNADPIRVEPNPLHMVEWVAGAVIHHYVGEGELSRHLDQGNAVCERSIGVRTGITFPNRRCHPGEPFYHRLHGVEFLGEHLLQIDIVSWTRVPPAFSPDAPASPKGCRAVPHAVLAVSRLGMDRTCVRKRHYLLLAVLRA
ncbi:hypothetical protein F2Q70_00005565 [Brassica cretica]|uniref:Uncharacterized protein n=2 Tax=Brassica cretica TaxID=69181 RepID=A0A8S9G3P6_BRACR|nr:hypothetical protein F2Q68_00022146 [Brassica cretica]KAF2575296.1 hypothetical protein F2Q70_00005565 [Brassica cretica]KAF3567372.1 hypothetical protein DY000_02018071 [Brassica cretica]